MRALLLAFLLAACANAPATHVLIDAKDPAFVVFTAGAPNAPRMYEEAGELVAGYGTPAAPVLIADRAAYRHASAQGATVMELEPTGRAADDVRRLYAWTCRQLDTKENA